MIDHDKNVGQMLDLLDELGLADDTFVHVLDRQRPAPEHLARRRHDAVPQREEHQLGRRLPRPAAGALAGQDRGRLGRQRDRAAPRLAADLPGHGRRPGRGRQAEEGLQGDRPDLQEPHRRLQPAAVPDRQGRRRARATSSSTSATTATCWRCAWTTGRSCSWSSASPARWASGRSRSCGCGCPRSSTCAPIRTSSRTITSNTYYDWMFHNAYFIYAAQAAAAKFTETFKEFPAVQKPNSFTIDDAMAKLSEPAVALTLRSTRACSRARPPLSDTFGASRHRCDISSHRRQLTFGARLAYHALLARALRSSQAVFGARFMEGAMHKRWLVAIAVVAFVGRVSDVQQNADGIRAADVQGRLCGRSG